MISVTVKERERLVNIQQELLIAFEDSEFEEDFKKSAMDNIDFLLGIICRLVST